MSAPTRFDVLKAALARKGVASPGGLAATIGRNKYGNARFAAMAARGRKKAAKKHPDAETAAESKGETAGMEKQEG